MQLPPKKMMLLILFAVQLAGVAVGVAEVKRGAKEMVLFGGSLGNVPFSHFRHQEAVVDCNGCHNLFPQAAGAIQELSRQDKLKQKEVMNQCTKCHKELVSSDQKGGPLKCKECHQKK